INHADPQISLTWAKLRLMELARYSQWPAPSGLTPGNLSDQLIAEVTARLTLDKTEADALRQALGDLHTALTVDGDTALRQWAALLEHPLGKQNTSLPGLLEFALEDQSLSDSMLLAQWGYAVSRAANDSLSKKWQSAENA